VRTFLDLSDTPSTLDGQGLKILRVNEEGTGLELAVLEGNDITSIAELSASLINLTEDVTNNRNNIYVLSGDIVDLNTHITNLNNQIDINKTNISTISGDVVDNTTNITLLSGAIEQFGTDITDYEIRITSNETNISTNIDNIQYNTVNIATLSAAVDGIDVDNFVDKTTSQVISGEKVFEDDFTVSAPADFGEDVTIGAGDSIFNVSVSDTGFTQIIVSGLLTEGVDDLSSLPVNSLYIKDINGVKVLAIKTT
jgi:chromosome segregation ATPase